MSIQQDLQSSIEGRLKKIGAPGVLILMSPYLKGKAINLFHTILTPVFKVQQKITKIVKSNDINIK